MNSKGFWIFCSCLLLFLFSLFVLFTSFFFFLTGASETYEAKGDIAFVELKGAILDSTNIVHQLDVIGKNSNIKGVLLRIDSPGGGVGASQEIYQAVLRLKKSKKVVVSMGGVAASGGYYVAVAADKIIANPGTVTGSIGVLMDYANVEELLDFLKIHAELITAGKMKDVGSPLRPLKEEDREYLKSLLNNMHGQFRKAVQEGRHLTDEQIQNVGEGQILTGEEAQKLGLVDELGNQQVALDILKQLIGFEGDPKIIYPEKKSTKLLDLFASEELEMRLRGLALNLRQGIPSYLSKGMYP